MNNQENKSTIPKPSGWLRLQYKKWFVILKNGISDENPIVVSVLGICSALAVTNRVENAIVMGIGVTFVIMGSSALVSILRNLIPSKVRMIAYMVIISLLTIVVQMFLQAYLPTVAANLGAYTGLIITNCIVMGRAEAFAIKNPLKYTLIDSFANGMGYMLVLIAIAAIREPLAFGTFLNMKIPGFENWINWNVMALAPGGFFVLTLLAWLMRTLTKNYEEN